MNNDPKTDTSSTYIAFEHDATSDEIHEHLCKAIHENDLTSLQWLAEHIADITDVTIDIQELE